VVVVVVCEGNVPATSVREDLLNNNGKRRDRRRESGEALPEGLARTLSRASEERSSVVARRLADPAGVWVPSEARVLSERSSGVGSAESSCWCRKEVERGWKGVVYGI